MRGSVGSNGGMHTIHRPRKKDKFPIKFYNRYIHSDKWKAKREAAFEKYGRKCSRCSSEHELEVHHKTYKRLGNEKLGDLQILCKTCHKNHHVRKRAKRDRQAARRSPYRHPEQIIKTVTFYPDRKRTDTEVPL